MTGANIYAVRCRKAILLVAPILLSALAAACTTETESDPALALACQTKPCICAPAELTLFNRKDSVPLKWKKNGDAYCPEGYVLRLSTKDKP